MANVTINDLSAEASVTTSDLIGLWDASAGTYDKATVANILATRMSGTGTVATGTFTLTVPATGTAALLGTAQSFTATQTIAPSSTGSIGMLVNMPASTTQRAIGWSYNGTTVGLIYCDADEGYLQMATRDMGNTIAGPSVRIERNSNATNAAAGTLRLMRATGTTVMYYCDSDAKLRQHTAAPTTGTDNGVGTLVGDQTSWHAAKDIVNENTDRDGALRRIMETPVYDFMLKAGSYQDVNGGRQIFTGVVGFERGDWVLKGNGPEQEPSLNEYTLFGTLIQAVQAQQEQINGLTARLAELESKHAE